MLRQIFAGRKESILDEAIERVLNDMEQSSPETQKYSELLSNLERLIILREEDKKRSRISPDTMAIVAGNLLGIFIIVAYEQRHVMTSKGWNSLLKTKHQ